VIVTGLRAVDEVSALSHQWRLKEVPPGNAEPGSLGKIDGTVTYSISCRTSTHTTMKKQANEPIMDVSLARTFHFAGRWSPSMTNRKNMVERKKFPLQCQESPQPA
jgi:hypothetical protein